MQLIAKRVTEIELWRLSLGLITTSPKNIENLKEECLPWLKSLLKIVRF